MYFWDLDQPSKEQFHRLKIIADDEEVEELPLISWVGPRADNMMPTLATAGKGLSLKIFAPLGSGMIDDDGQGNEVYDRSQAPAMPQVYVSSS